MPRWSIIGGSLTHRAGTGAARRLSRVARALLDVAMRDGDGEPGPRMQYGPLYYAAYLLDPDGLRVEIVANSR